MLIDPTSLSRTIDAVDARLSEGMALSEHERKDVVAWVLGRQVWSGRSGGLFAPLPGEFELGVHLYTGERLRTRVATRSVLTMESARILGGLAGDRDDVHDALSHAAVAMRHTCFAVSHCVIGECAHSSIAYMRAVASDRSGDGRKWIERHVRVIADHRDGTGRWRRFPFYYTLLALLEAGTPSANAELEYAQSACERAIGRSSGAPRADRRRRVLERVLAERPPATEWR